MALPRVLLATPQGGGYVDELSGGGFLPVTYPELTARPSAAQDAAARARPMLPPGMPWIPYTPMFTRGPFGPNDMGINETDIQPPEWPVFWFANYYGKTAWPGAGPFFKVSTEAQAEDVLRRAGVDTSREFMTLDASDPGKGARDRRMVLYARSGDLWQPLASYPYYKPSSWVSFRDEDMIPIAAVALAVAGGPIVQAIGNALVPGALAAQFPALPGIVGSTALQTATNGGDLGAALQNAVLGQVGMQAGAFAADASGFKALGAATSAATTAALRGGDVKDAVTGSLLQFGASNMGDLWDSITGYFTPAADPSASYFDPVYDAPSPEPSGGLTWEDPSGYVFTDAPGSAPVVTALPAPGGADTSSGWDFGDVVQGITNAAMAAIKINQAYQATQAPPRTALTTGNMTQTPNANGTVTVRNASTGQVLGVQKPQAGVPFVLADGRTIINNGDGTYTLINRDGTQQRVTYTSNLPTAPNEAGGLFGSIPPAYLLGGAALLGALLLSRRRA